MELWKSSTMDADSMYAELVRSDRSVYQINIVNGSQTPGNLGQEQESITTNRSTTLTGALQVAQKLADLKSDPDLHYQFMYWTPP